MTYFTPDIGIKHSNSYELDCLIWFRSAFHVFPLSVSQPWCGYWASVARFWPLCPVLMSVIHGPDWLLSCQLGVQPITAFISWRSAHNWLYDVTAWGMLMSWLTMKNGLFWFNIISKNYMFSDISGYILFPFLLLWHAPLITCHQWKVLVAVNLDMIHFET